MEELQCLGLIRQFLVDLAQCESHVERAGEEIVVTLVMSESMFSRYLKAAFRPALERKRLLH